MVNKHSCGLYGSIWGSSLWGRIWILYWLHNRFMLCYKVIEHILGFLDDPVTVVRSGSVNQLWNTIVKCLVRRGRLKYIQKTLRRLKTTESFNESSSIKEAKIHAFKVFNIEASAWNQNLLGRICFSSGCREDSSNPDGDYTIEVPSVIG